MLWNIWSCDIKQFRLRMRTDRVLRDINPWSSAADGQETIDLTPPTLIFAILHLSWVLARMYG